MRSSRKGARRSAFGISIGGNTRESAGERRYSDRSHPNLLCVNNYGPGSSKVQGDLSVRSDPDCVQIVSKNHQEYQNKSNNIKLYRNPGTLETAPIFMDFHYFLYLRFFLRFLHTVEVRGSSPLSPTTPQLRARSFSSPLMA
jgi:hypothetical protein